MGKSICRIMTLLLSISIVLGGVAISPVWSAWDQWGEDQKLNTDGTAYYQELAVSSPSVAVFQSEIYTVWTDNRNGMDGKADIFFSKGVVDADGRVNYGSNLRVNDVSNSAGNDWSSRPSIAVNQDGYIYVVWSDNRNSDNQKNSEDIYLARSVDGGVSFQANKQMDLFPEDSKQYDDCRAPKVAATGNHVYVIFGGSDRMHIAVSNDKGQTFSLARTIEGGSIDRAVIAASGNNVYLAQASSAAQMTDFDDIYFAKSTNNGATFSDFETINDDSGGMRQGDVTLAASGEHVYLLWRDQRDGWSLYMAESHDQGSTFGANALVTDAVGTPNVSVSAYNDHVAMSYTLNRTIVAKVSHNAGGSWSKEMLVSDVRNPIEIGPSSIAINDQIVGVIWEERASDNSDIYGDGFRFADGGSEAPQPTVCPTDSVTLTIEGTQLVLDFPELCFGGIITPFEYKLILKTDGTWTLAPR